MSEPQHMFRVFSTESITTYGLGYFVDQGEVVDVNGQPMVASGGVIFEIADRWYATREQALAQFAGRCQSLGERFLVEAAALREGRDVGAVA